MTIDAIERVTTGKVQADPAFVRPKLGTVIDLDLSEPLSEAAFQSRVVTPLFQNSVIVFRGAPVSADQVVRFCARLGKLETHVFNQHLLPGYPQILHLSNVEEGGKLIGRPNQGDYWHTDLTYIQRPNQFSVLHAQEVPTDAQGKVYGNTRFRSTIAAYESLQPAMKAKLAGLRARHFHAWVRRGKGDEVGIELSDEQRKKMEGVTHPVVCIDPNSGRKYLFVNLTHTVAIEGMSAEESESTLNYLYEHIAAQETYVHHWRVGDLVIWDNLTTQHSVLNDYALPMRRRMWRLSIDGDPPKAAE